MSGSIAEQDTYSKTLLGFWIYLMTDCVLFATLFATYMVLHNNTYGGPSAKDLFSLPFALTETMILLTSSFTSGLGVLATQTRNKKQVIFWFVVTFLLGISFLCMELTEFSHFIEGGNGWERSGFLTGFFTLVGTHGLHITTGLVWMVILIIPVIFQGVTEVSFKRLACLGLFWHFLDVVWIFIFTVVYLMGVM